MFGSIILIVITLLVSFAGYFSSEYWMNDKLDLLKSNAKALAAYAKEMVESFFNLSALCVGLLGKTVGQLALHQLAAVAYEVKDGQEEKV